MYIKFTVLLVCTDAVRGCSEALAEWHMVTELAGTA
jgi:hypothetical protein